MSKMNVRHYMTMLVMIFGFQHVGASFEFDEKALAALGFGAVDLSAFSGEKGTNQGEYKSRIYINNDLVLREADIRFYRTEDGEDVCFTGSMLNKLPIKKQYYLNQPIVNIDESVSCYGISVIDPDIKIDFDGRNHDLRLTMPHIYLDRYDPQWVSPQERDNGIAGLVLDYNVIQSYSRHKGYASSRNLVSYGAVGANIGAFRFRSHYQYSRVSRDGDSNSDFEWDQVYGFMDIPQLSARMYAGEFYSSSNAFSSMRFQGISFYTDETMMPSFMKGYAPQVTGTVLTDATITISQGNRIIRALQVPAGSFEIADLPSNLNGIVQVKIEESDGSIRTYDTEIAQVPFLTRKGDLCYFINAGKLSPRKTRWDENRITSNFTASEFSYGLTNRVSIYGGLATISKDYHAINAGVGIDLGVIGAFSGDITRSSAKFDDTDNINNMKGVAYRFNYAKKLTNNLNLNLIGYRFSSREYLPLDGYVSLKKGYADVDREKNRLVASLTHSFIEDNSSINISYEKGSYWNTGNSSNINVGYNKRIKSGLLENAQLSLTAMRRSHASRPTENILGLFLSIPLNDNSATMRYNTSYSDRDENYIHRLSYYNGEDWGSYQVGVESSLGKNTRSDYGLTGSVLANTQYGSFRASGREARDTRYLSAEFDGSITLTAKGIVAHQQVYGDGSRLIVDAGVADVALDQYRELTSNSFGLIGVSNVSNYYHSQYRVDNDNLPSDVEIQDSVINLAVSKGAIAYRNLNAITGAKVVAIITLDDGSHPPFGAVVLRENGEDREVGLIAQNGLTYLTGLNNSAKYIVKWGANQQCDISIGISFDPNEIQNLTCSWRKSI